MSTLLLSIYISTAMKAEKTPQTIAETKNPFFGATSQIPQQTVKG